MPEDTPAPDYTVRQGVNLMPWHIKAGQDGLLRDSILVATMNGDEMLTISLHVATSPLRLPLPKDSSSSNSAQ